MTAELQKNSVAQWNDPAKALDGTWITQSGEKLLGERQAKAALNAVATTDVEKLTLDRAIVTSIDSSVSDMITDAPITDQKHSGRCWAFAGLNVLRARVIAEQKLSEFELSQNFIYFYDKLEKANVFLVRAGADADRPLDDREVAAAMAEPISDGGWWAEFAALVAKYGLVPHYAMPDTNSATNSDAMNAHLSSLLRRAGLRIRAAIADGSDAEAIRQVTMNQVHRVLAIHLGVPPKSFIWQFRDKDKNFTRAGAMTPLEFAAKIMPDPADYLVLVHDPRAQMSMHTRYATDRTEAMVGCGPQTHVTAELSELKQAVIDSVQAGEPVWFACDVKTQFDKDLGMWDAKLHDYTDLYGVDFSMSKAERLETRESAPTHAMVFTGVDLVDGVPRRWRVQNSWGEKVGEKGYWTMNDSWFDEYVYQVIARSDRLSETIREAAATEPILLPSWDAMA